MRQVKNKSWEYTVIWNQESVTYTILCYDTYKYVCY